MSEEFDPFKLNQRFKQLEADGYVRFLVPGRYEITQKGVAVLMSCADRPVPVQKLAKTSRLIEAQAIAESARKPRDLEKGDHENA